MTQMYEKEEEKITHKKKILILSLSLSVTVTHLGG